MIFENLGSLSRGRRVTTSNLKRRHARRNIEDTFPYVFVYYIFILWNAGSAACLAVFQK